MNCSGKELKENKSICNRNKHSLEIGLIANFDFTLDNVKIKLSKKIPAVQYSSRYSLRSAIIVPIITKDTIPKDPVPSTDIEAELHLKTFSTGEQICLDLEPGEYFGSIENIESDRFGFKPIESKLIFFTFGYGFYLNGVYRKNTDPSFFNHQFSNNDVANYNEKECSYGNFDYRWDGDHTGKQIAECAKIEVKKDTVSKITIFVNERQFQSFWKFFGKLFPGIFILATFTNMDGHYYKRDYRIETNRVAKE